MTMRPDDKERARQAALDRLDIPGFTDTALDDIVRMAAQMCDAPIALVSIIDGDRQWFKASFGVEATSTARELAFCTHAIENPNEVMVVEDAAADARFADNPLVVGDPHIRFYAGAPLVTRSGHAIGTVCVLGDQPRTIDPERLESLRFLAQQVMTKLEERRR